MTTKDKYKFIFVSILLFFVGGWAGWGYFKLYIYQIINPESVLIGDPVYIMSFFFGSSLFLGCSISVFTVVQLFFWIKFKKIFRLSQVIDINVFRKSVVVIIMIGGGWGVLSNSVLLHNIVPEKYYTQCPKKIGYKKNLLRDYVLDVSQCEKF